MQLPCLCAPPRASLRATKHHPPAGPSGTCSPLPRTALNVVRHLPFLPQATKHHPSSVDLELIKRLASSTAASSLTSFLAKEFDCIPRDLAGGWGWNQSVGVEGGMFRFRLRCDCIPRDLAGRQWLGRWHVGSAQMAEFLPPALSPRCPSCGPHFSDAYICRPECRRADSG